MQARYTKPIKVRGLQGIRGGLLGSPYRRLMIYCWGYAMVDPYVWKCLQGGIASYLDVRMQVRIMSQFWLIDRSGCSPQQLNAMLPLALLHRYQWQRRHHRRRPPLPPPCHRHIVCSYYAVRQSGCPCPHPGFCYHSSLIFGSSLVAKVLTLNAYTLNLELPALLRIERPLTLSVLHGANLNLAKSNCAVSESGVRFRVSGFGSRVLIPSPKNETLLVRDPLFGGRWVFGVPIMVPNLEWDYDVLFG